MDVHHPKSGVIGLDPSPSRIPSCQHLSTNLIGGFSPPLWKIWVRQMGVWFPTEWKNCPKHSKTTKLIDIFHWYSRKYSIYYIDISTIKYYWSEKKRLFVDHALRETGKPSLSGPRSSSNRERVGKWQGLVARIKRFSSTPHWCQMPPEMSGSKETESDRWWFAKAFWEAITV